MLFCFYIGNHPFLIIAKHSFTHLFNIIIPFYLTLLLSLVLRCKGMVKGNGENQNNGKNEDYAHLFDKCQIFHEQAYKTEKCLQIQKS